ncbi:MAG: dicarboxylate/amino acid:cation symporter [Alphaproteobacteria bacterium]|nr:dicarboxylate/amino acid:cation symporter [Alphaproteobacteria bacterium]
MDTDLLVKGGRRAPPLWVMMLAGLAAGVGAGILFGPGGIFALPAEALLPATDWVMLPARLFLALITMIVIPLVFCSILLAITESGGFSFLRSVGPRVAVYFVCTTCVAVLLGILISGFIQPAQHVPDSWLSARMGGAEQTLEKAAMQIGGGKSIPQMIVGIIPVNPAAAVMQQEMLQLVIAALLAGLALVALPRAQAQPVISFCSGVQAACMKIVFWALKLAPLAVFGFLFRLTVETGPEMLTALSWYIGTVLSGLGAVLVMYMLILSLVARRSPLAFLAAIRDAQMLAFSSSSSAAAMPLTLATAESRLGVRPTVARLVVPLGTTVNMDGTAVYQVIVALFLTGLMGIELSFVQTALLALTIVGASIGSPGSPGVGLVILSVILTNIGIPPEAIGIILSVDRLLDMCRTVVNVTGDLVAATVVDRWVSDDRVAMITGDRISEQKAPT